MEPDAVMSASRAWRRPASASAAAARASASDGYTWNSSPGGCDRKEGRQAMGGNKTGGSTPSARRAAASGQLPLQHNELGACPAIPPSNPTPEPSPPRHGPRRSSPAMGTLPRPTICTAMDGPASGMLLPAALFSDRTLPTDAPAATTSPMRSVPAWRGTQGLAWGDARDAAGLLTHRAKSPCTACCGGMRQQFQLAAHSCTHAGIQATAQAAHLHQQRGHCAALAVEVGLDDGAGRQLVGGRHVALLLGHPRQHLQQVLHAWEVMFRTGCVGALSNCRLSKQAQPARSRRVPATAAVHCIRRGARPAPLTRALLCRHVDHGRVAAPLLGHQAQLQQALPAGAHRGAETARQASARARPGWPAPAQLQRPLQAARGRAPSPPLRRTWPCLGQPPACRSC